MQLNLSQSLLVLVFRSARTGRRPNLSAFCKRSGVGVAELQQAFDQLEQQALLSFSAEGERLTLKGLAVAAALARLLSASRRPLASCRALAA